MNLYEYCLQKYDGKGLLGGKFDLAAVQDEFNKRGQEGWELVSFMGTSQDLGATRWIIATFKRIRK